MVNRLIIFIFAEIFYRKNKFMFAFSHISHLFQSFVNLNLQGRLNFGMVSERERERERERESLETPTVDTLIIYITDVFVLLQTVMIPIVLSWRYLLFPRNVAVFLSVTPNNYVIQIFIHYMSNFNKSFNFNQISL